MTVITPKRRSKKISPPRMSLARKKEARDAWAMVAPLTIIVVAIIIVPIIWSVVLSFQDATYRDVSRNGLANAFTLENYVGVFTSAGFWRSLWITLIYTTFTTLGSITVGFLAALAMRNAFRGRGIMRALMLLPYVAPVVAAAFVWKIMLNPQYGIVNAVGQTFLGWDNPVNFLGLAPYALITVIVFEIWRYFPFAMIFFAASLTGLSREVEEAALVDGATPWQKFWHIILPQMMPTVVLLTLLRLVMTFNKFDDIYILTGGAADTQVAAVRVYDLLNGSQNIGAASANAVVLACVLAVSLFFYTRWTKRKELS